MVKVSEEIDWLRKNEDRKRIFDLIAAGPIAASELRKRLGASDWWVIGIHLEDLAKHGLIAAGDGGYTLTDGGREVHGMLSRLGEIPRVPRA